MDVSECWVQAYRKHELGQVSEAVEICQREPCASNSVDCQRFLGWTEYTSQAFDIAIFWFEKASKEGDLDSIYGLASTYFKKGDYKKSIFKYKEAIDRGYYRPCYWLAYMYEKGLGVNKDHDQSVKYLKLGMEHGYLMCERTLLELEYRSGSLLRKVFIKVKLVQLMIKCYKIAAADLVDPRLSDVPSFSWKK